TVVIDKILSRTRNSGTPARERITLGIVVGLLARCASGPGYDEQVKQSYRTGMSREEAHTALASANLLSSVTRPAAGWSATDGSNDRAGQAAFHYERNHPPSQVQSCEVS